MLEKEEPRDERPHTPSTISSTSPRHFEELEEDGKENDAKISSSETIKAEELDQKKEDLENKKPSEPEKVKPADVNAADQTPEAVSKPTSALKPLQPSAVGKRVPQFYIPMGRSTLTAAELSAKMEKIQDQILEALAAPPSPPLKKSGEDGGSETSKTAELEPVSTEKPTVNTAIPFSRFGIVTKVC